MPTEAADELRVKKQFTSCKTEESSEDSALGGSYARETEGEQERCQDSQRKRIAGSRDPGDEHKTSYSWNDGWRSARGRANRSSSHITLQRRCEFGARSPDP